VCNHLVKKSVAAIFPNTVLVPSQFVSGKFKERYHCQWSFFSSTPSKKIIGEISGACPFPGEHCGVRQGYKIDDGELGVECAREVALRCAFRAVRNIATKVRRRRKELVAMGVAFVK
jgi:hypothetical protein